MLRRTSILLVLLSILLLLSAGAAQAQLDPGSPRGCSGPSVTPINISIQNLSDADLDLYWVDSNCNEIFYEMLSVGETFFQQSYVGHVWIVRTTFGQILVGEQSATDEGERIIFDSATAVNATATAVPQAPAQQVAPVRTIPDYAVCPADFAGYVAPRLVQGFGTAQIEPGGVPNRLRAEPSTRGVQVGEAQPGRTLDQVIRGPACNEGFVWWLVEHDGITGWTAESNVATQDYYISPTGSGTVFIPPDPADGGAAAPAGTANADGFLSRELVQDFAFVGGDNPFAYLLVEVPVDGTVRGEIRWVDWTTGELVDSWDAAYLNGVLSGFDEIDLLGPNLVTMSGFGEGITTVRFWGAIGQMQSSWQVPSLSLQFGSVFDTHPTLPQVAVAGCAEVGQNGCVRSSLQLYEASGNLIADFTSAFHQSAISKVEFSPDGTRLATLSVFNGLGELKIWDVPTASNVATFSAPLMFDFAFMGDGSALYYGACNQQVFNPSECTAGILQEIPMESLELGSNYQAFSSAPIYLDATATRLMAATESGQAMIADTGSPFGLLGGAYILQNGGAELYRDIALTPDGQNLVLLDLSGLRLQPIE